MKVNISLHDGVDLNRFSDQLSSTGIRVSNKMDMLNMLTVEIPDQKTLQQVRGMQEVCAAEPDREVRAI